MGEYFIKLYDNEYVNSKQQKLLIDEDLANLYNIPYGIFGFFDNKIHYITSFRKFCNGNQQLFR